MDGPLPERELSGRMDGSKRALFMPPFRRGKCGSDACRTARAPSKADAAVDRRRRGGKDGGVRVRPSAVCSRLSLSLE